MNPLKTTRWLAVVALLATGCGDEPRNVGNDTDSGSVDVPFDITRTDTGVDASLPTDRGNDTGAVDTGNDTGPVDTGAVDAGPTDTGPVDTGVVDAGPADTGNDTGPADTGTVDAGPRDAGPTDAGPADTGAVDAGPMDAGPTDAGNADVVTGDGAVCVAVTESCNGRDDDCDGLIDESGCNTHLLITELGVTPNEAEFVEIHNPTNAPIDLTNFYLADTNAYACRLPGVTCTPAGATIESSDFIARFPAGATIAAGQYLTVTLAQPSVFQATFGRCPDFYVSRGTVTLGSCSPMTTRALNGAGAVQIGDGGIGDAGVANTIGSSLGLTNGGEMVVLYSWDGTSPRVVDQDLVVFGSPSDANRGFDKTGVVASFNGMMHTYLADTVPAMQSSAPVHANFGSSARCNFAEGTQRRTGSNGVGGNDESSENLAQTWRVLPPAAQPDGGIAINATPGAENNCR